jgi:acyl-CoA reductase-like NAD-dependent aldehyde dehydrogenase
MSKLSLIAAMALGGLVACSTLATAQNSTATPDAKKGGKNRMTVEQQMERMTTQLNLTAEQKPKVEAVLKESSKKRQEIMNDSSIDRSQMREKMQPIMEKQNEKLKGILTEEQFKKYQEMQQRAKKGAKNAEKKSE